jgi:chitodextrinase
MTACLRGTLTGNDRDQVIAFSARWNFAGKAGGSSGVWRPFNLFPDGS